MKNIVEIYSSVVLFEDLLEIDITVQSEFELNFEVACTCHCPRSGDGSLGPRDTKEATGRWDHVG